MLGKAEYVKFVLRSLCEERARIFVSDKIVAGEVEEIQSLSSKSTIDFLNEKGWYDQFITDLEVTSSPEFVKMYRFAAFVSSNISEQGKKDKFDIKKSDDGDDTAAEHAEEFSKKGKLTNFEQVPGEWHLQGIFISVVEELKEAL